jgi:hypothetical protein
MAFINPKNCSLSHYIAVFPSHSDLIKLPISSNTTKKTYLKICRGSRQGLHIDAPLIRVQMKSFKGSLLTQKLDLVNIFVSSIVSCSWVSFRILVG